MDIEILLQKFFGHDKTLDLWHATLWFLSVSLGGTIIVFVFRSLNLDVVPVLVSMSLGILLIILRWFYDEQRKDKRANELGRDDNFVEEYIRIKKDPNTIKCFLIWCGDYNESEDFSFSEYFSNEARIIKNHKYVKDFNWKRIICYSMDKENRRISGISSEHFEAHNSKMKEVNITEKKYDAKISKIKNLELVYSERERNGQTLHSALVILFDTNLKPIWGYQADTGKNPEYKDMILSIRDFFLNEWERADKINWNPSVGKWTPHTTRFRIEGKQKNKFLVHLRK